jgi:hypothetical protein
VAILGTTISPYLFFWQAAEEVEEGRAKGRGLTDRKDATGADLRSARADTMVGMFFSNLIMYFIILTTAATLHGHGQTDIATARQAAEALRPLAGNGAYLLFTLGLVGTGMLGVPVLVGSYAYAVAEGAVWRGSMADKPRSARKFYAVMAVAMALGLVLNYLGLNAVKMLFWSAVINGLLAPFNPACRSPNQQPQSDGKAREPGATQVPRLGYLRSHDCGRSGDDHHLLKCSCATASQKYSSPSREVFVTRQLCWRCWSRGKWRRSPD